MLAESSRPSLLFDLLRPGGTRTTCSDQGVASYWAVPAVDTADVPTDDIATRCPTPSPVTAMVCFFDERVDFVVDGRAPRPAAHPWEMRRAHGPV